MSDWRTIETAPKDGRDVLVYVPGFGMGPMVLFWDRGYWREKANCMGLKREPTHWATIPEITSLLQAERSEGGSPQHPIRREG